MKSGKNLFLIDIPSSVEEKRLDIIIPETNKEGTMTKKFSVICGNPPYNQPSTGGSNGARDLWDSFVPLCMDICEDSGHVCLVHPSKWRKPEHKLWDLLKDKLSYLYIASKKEGFNVFGAITRFDWYVAAKTKQSICKISDENNHVSELDLKSLPFLPNFDFEVVLSLLPKHAEPCCDVIYSRSIYGCDKSWIKKEKDSIHVYPCVYGMYKDGSIKWLYSSKQSGHFGIPKVIVSCGEHPYPFIDMEGEYGMCNNAFGIKVENKLEAENICKALKSDKFENVLAATCWGNFQIEWRMFRYFRKDFWKEFI